MERNGQKVAAVVPAYNEELRISAVLEAIKQAELVDEIIVVSDGSVDRTYEVASSDPRIKAIRLDRNHGKAGAMCVGVAATEADVLLFLDADLINLRSHQIDELVRPVLDNNADMVVGVFRAGRGPTDLAQILAPNISGQRVLRRSDFLNIPELDDLRSGVEVAITKYYRASGLTVRNVVLAGCTHSMKEEKIGLAHGFAARLRMYYEIGKVLTNGHAILDAAKQAKEALRSSVERE